MRKYFGSQPGIFCYSTRTTGKLEMQSKFKVQTSWAWAVIAVPSGKPGANKRPSADHGQQLHFEGNHKFKSILCFEIIPAVAAEAQTLPKKNTQEQA